MNPPTTHRSNSSSAILVTDTNTHLSNTNPPNNSSHYSNHGILSSSQTIQPSFQHAFPSSFHSSSSLSSITSSPHGSGPIFTSSQQQQHPIHHPLVENNDLSHDDLQHIHHSTNNISTMISNQETLNLLELLMQNGELNSLLVRNQNLSVLPSSSLNNTVMMNNNINTNNNNNHFTVSSLLSSPTQTVNNHELGNMMNNHHHISGPNTSSATQNNLVLNSLMNNPSLSILNNNINNNTVTNSSSAHPPPSTPSGQSLLGSKGNLTSDNSQKESQKTSEEPTTAPLTHPIACLACRKIHKRCDKKLPTCTRCLTKGVHCEYKEPVFKKAGLINLTANNNNTSSSLLNNNSNNTENNSSKKSIDVISIFNSATQDLDESARTAIQSIKQNTIEAYCLIVCNGSPPIRQEDLTKLLLTGSQELLRRKDVLALMLAIQGSVEMVFGFSDLAEESFIKSRNLIMHYFDDFDNPFAAVTYSIIALFNATIGKPSKARGYLHLTDQFIANWKQKNMVTMVTTESPFVESHAHGISLSISNLRVQQMVVELISCETHPVPDIATFEKISLDLLGSSLPPKIKEFFKRQHFSRDDIDEMLRNFEVFVSLLHYSVKPTFKSEFSVKIHHLNYLLLMNGLRILFLLLAGCNIACATENNPEHIQLLESSALAISKITEDELFVFVSPYLISFILVAVRTNLEICKMIDRGERENLRPVVIKKERITIPNIVKQYQENELIDYYAVVAKDLRALQVLSKRYRYVAPHTKELEEFLSRRNNEYSEQISQLFGNQWMNSLSSLHSFDSSSSCSFNTAQEKKMNRVGTFYNEMRDFLLKFNNRIEDAFEGGSNGSHPAISPLNGTQYLERKLREANVESLSDLELLLSEISSMQNQHLSPTMTNTGTHHGKALTPTSQGTSTGSSSSGNVTNTSSSPRASFQHSQPQHHHVQYMSPHSFLGLQNHASYNYYQQPQQQQQHAVHHHGLNATHSTTLNMNQPYYGDGFFDPLLAHSEDADVFDSHPFQQ
ncbi:hypothetical protein FDP41_004984 [Naegleria fowleri]|uniref:Zn(2)-C6 fungal-type domain-containing protein n=1 Tax=Naegleria fowleri TaxID=5763 RepID=A0A6A5BF35_NAEFO|nr:uncharacterized protein FDP41_004984 [Naegleria fowleri]KAF0975657.1 hypothetical protein FDP41_004984 [Naegleria fowleri]